jgi:hypothetical protein
MRRLDQPKRWASDVDEYGNDQKMRADLMLTDLMLAVVNSGLIKTTPEILRGFHLPCLMVEPRAAASIKIPVGRPCIWFPKVHFFVSIIPGPLV